MQTSHPLLNQTTPSPPTTNANFSPFLKSDHTISPPPQRCSTVTVNHSASAARVTQLCLSSKTNEFYLHARSLRSARRTYSAARVPWHCLTQNKHDFQNYFTHCYEGLSWLGNGTYLTITLLTTNTYLRKFNQHSVATALASSVLPVPGGP